MTDAVSLKPDLGRYGVWLPTRSITPELATRIESLGYGAAWIGGSPDADLSWAEPALAETSSLQLATGIINIWSSPASAVAESYHCTEKEFPGRFLLGIEVGHREHSRPYRCLPDPVIHVIATFASQPTGETFAAERG
jgi:alkanesulfonate monooxygenase SsuD/methylene tetrahydromethanopterin reductase-like flavin-dependent oxidoreductase (luciferase family)